MDKVKKTLTTERSLPFSINESLISMILGAVVVVIVGILAYNYFKAQKGVDTTPSAQSEAVNQQNGQIGSANNAVALPTDHSVTAGENLWTISEKYYKSGYNYVDIARANNISDPNIISVGQKLKIPVVTNVKSTTIAAATPPEVTLSKIEGKSYTVNHGDFLWEIALRAYGDGYRWAEIAKVNKLDRPDVIHAGNVLNLPR